MIGDSMNFYTNISQRGNRIYFRGYKDGQRVQFWENYKPYMFVPSDVGTYKTLSGAKVAKLDFDTIKEAKEYSQQYKDVSNREVYGFNNFQYMYIYDRYKGEINYDPSKVNVASIDIECAADEGFPDIALADKEITAVTMRIKGHSVVLGCGDFVTDDPKIKYIKCLDEDNLLMKFVDVWRAMDIDIITGWNIEFFDIPYLTNRIINRLGMDMASKLSPFGNIRKRGVDFRGQENESYLIEGISVLDYYHLYRKFKFSNQESYKLDYIAQVELGEKKIDYSEYGNLLDLYKNNYQKFIEYNIHDCVLVDRLEDKLKFIEQVMAFAYDAKVNYTDTLTTVRPWDVIIHNYLLDKRIVIPQLKVDDSEGQSLVGGYVKEPKLGLSEWVVSYDLNSLYPHLIMQYNISPETFVKKDELWPGLGALLDKRLDLDNFDPNRDYAHAANGCAYTKKFQGFLPSLMEKMYDDRVTYKKKMIEAKKRYEQDNNPEDEKLIARYHNMQLAKKIQLNSAYGALGNKYFRWFNHKHAEAITTSGQLAIRWIERAMNSNMNKMLGTSNEDYIIASDTDSIYVEMKSVIDNVFVDKKVDEQKIVDALDEFIEAKIQPFMDSSYAELANYMNAYKQKMMMKRETIANKGIWRGKKMYILNCWDVEGVRFKEPNLKMQGIESVRSSTPQACRNSIKEALGIIMNEDEISLHAFIKNFREEFLTLPFQQVAFPRGIKGMQKYRDSAMIYKKGTPIQVKGALLYNNLLKELGDKRLKPIQNGDKVRFVYLKMPNPIKDTVIAAPDKLPEGVELDKYIDKDMQFNKSFLEPIRSITNVIGWDVEHTTTLEDFFS